MEQVYATDLEAQASTLAHHLFQACADSEKTITYLMLAANRARAGAAHEEALSDLDNALSMCEGGGLRVAELTEQRAAALLSIGRRAEAVEGYRKAIALYERAGELAKAAGASLTLAHDQHWHIEVAAGHRTVDRALELLGATEPELKDTLLSMRGLMMSTSGDTSGEARVFAEVKARRNAERGQRDKAFDEILEMICLFHSMQLPRMLPLATRRAETQRVAGDLWGVADAEFCVGPEVYCGRILEASTRRR
jgi:tetratricopeptide (TPR) repeat protein